MDKYLRLIRDMRETARKAGEEDNTFICKLCGLKLKEAADEFEKLIRRLEDDGK